MYGLLICMTACSEFDESKPLEPQESIANAEVAYENGIIVLKNSQVLSNILRGEVNISNTFTSQQDIMG